MTAGSARRARFAVLGIWHETNTFSSVPADLAAFEAEALLRGDAIIDEYQGSQSTIAGFLEAGADLGFSAVPLVHARTGPIGLITADAFDRIVGEMVDALAARGPFDGVLLANHGAAVCAEFPDVDGEVARRVRAVVGPAVPVGMALDLHANLSRQTARHTSVITVYQTNPHLDARVRGYECAALVHRAACAEIAPVQWLETPPMVINIVKQHTGAEPMRSIIADAAEAARRPRLLSTSAVQGYPYADVEEMGMSFLAVSDADESAARDAARWMAGRAWDRRAAMTSDVPSPTTAIENAMRASRGPVVVMDVGDNVGGGSAADSTILLEHARRLGARSLLQAVYDPAAVAACAAAGEGARISLEVGGKTDDLHGRPFAVTGRVTRLADGRYEDPAPTHGGFRFFDDGARAVLETEDGHTLVLTSRRAMSISLQQFRSLGIDPATFQIIVAKGVVSPRAAYEPIAAEIILADTAGLTTADLSTFAYHQRRRPLFPFEDDASYEPATS